MIDEKTWEEFCETGMLWFTNRILQVFGWSIVVVTKGNVIDRVIPARVKFRGFNTREEEEGFKLVSSYMTDNADELYDEVHGE